MSNGLKPLGSKVLVRPTPPDTASAGGIIFPEVHSERSAQSGTVVSVGSGTAAAHRIRQATIASARGRVAQALDLFAPNQIEAVSAADAALARYALETAMLSEVAEGDFVAFPFTAGTLLEVNGETLIVIDEAAIEAVWKPEVSAA
ncbi:MAG: hypothetical protein AB7P99_04685 [Vicinamibacterales bacterium]